MTRRRVLNLYAGIGGNRKLWENVDVTAVEINPTIANVYRELHPDDEVVVGDAHQYLLEHYDDGWDFIWSSPPCPTHSQIRFIHAKNPDNCKPKYPDMKLYEEILFLQGYFENPWVVENVVSWYEPLIKPIKIQRHYYWSNFVITKMPGKHEHDNIVNGNVEKWEQRFGFDLSKFDLPNELKGLMLRNAVAPEFGNHIFKCAFRGKQIDLKLFGGVDE